MKELNMLQKGILLFSASLFALAALTLSGCTKTCNHDSIQQSTVQAKCDKEGYTLNECADCSYSFRTDWVLPLGHTLTETVVPPTCNTEGYTKKECSVCHLSYQSNLTQPLSHELTETVIAPSCDEEGYTQKSCKNCDYTYKTNIQKPLGHTLSAQTLAPTCENEGHTTLTCSVCGFSYESDVQKPLGHSLTSSVTYPTRTQNGTLTKICDCGYQYENPLIYSDVFAGGIVSNTEVLARGVDVSVYQHVSIGGVYQPLDWGAIKAAGFEFAILKAGSTPRTVGDVQKGGMDATFEMDYRDAKAAGIELGVYFYSYATTLEQVKSDAMLLISWLEDKQLEYPVYFDLEDPSLVSLGQDALTEFCITFISTLQEHGYYGALYSNNNWLKQNLHGEALKNVFDVWYARYPEDRKNADNPLPVSATYTWNATTYGPQLGMWQYTDYGVIDGIDPDIKFDFNYAFRDYPALIKYFGYNGYETQL